MPFSTLSPNSLRNTGNKAIGGILARKASIEIELGRNNNASWDDDDDPVEIDVWDEYRCETWAEYVENYYPQYWGRYLDRNHPQGIESSFDINEESLLDYMEQRLGSPIHLRDPEPASNYEVGRTVARHLRGEGFQVEFHDDPTCSGEFAFYEAPQEVDAWEDITGYFRDKGYHPSRRAGAHTHVDMSGVIPGKVIDVMVAVARLEDALFTIANSGSYHRGEEYCRRFGHHFGMYRLMGGSNASPWNIAREWGRERYRALNIQPYFNACRCGATSYGFPEECVCTEHRTVEFRLWDSTLDPTRIVTYLTLSSTLVETVMNGTMPAPGLTEDSQVEFLTKTVAREPKQAEMVLALANGDYRDRR